MKNIFSYEKYFFLWKNIFSYEKNSSLLEVWDKVVAQKGALPPSKVVLEAKNRPKKNYEKILFIYLFLFFSIFFYLFLFFLILN